MRGIPWSYTWRELKDLFAEIGDVQRADVMVSEDGRSRVSRRGEELASCSHHIMNMCSAEAVVAAAA